MKYTNRLNIPIPIMAWLITNEYNVRTDNAISVTTLLKSVRQIILGRRYKESNKEVDVSDLVNSRMGTAIHSSIENALEEKNFIKVMSEYGLNNPEALYAKITSEKRTDKELLGFTITGQFDLAYNGYVMDIKSTSTWKYVLGDGDDYIKQMSIYKWLNQDIITQDVGYICYIFTDWSQVKAMQDSQYPQARIQIKEFPLMSLYETEQYIREKLDLIKYHEDNNTSDDRLPECSAIERWEEKPVWKYYKDATKLTRSTKNYDNPSEAYRRFHDDGAKGKIIEVKGESKACKYCAYINYCNQYEELRLLGLV